MLDRITWPVISRTLVPDGATDPGRLADALARLTREDPTLRLAPDPGGGRLVVSGRSESHLDAAVAKVSGSPGLVAAVGPPAVAYRQTISAPVEHETRLIRQTGGRGLFAIVTLRFEPLTRTQCDTWAARRSAEGRQPDPDGLYFANETAEKVLPRECVCGAEAGFYEAATTGVPGGFPCVALLATLLGGKYHDVGGYWQGFGPAAFQCSLDALGRAGLTLLEPVMRVAVDAPQACLDALADDLERRRGVLLDFSTAGSRAVVRAHVPLADLLGYADHLLRTAPAGTASFRAEPDHYAPAPARRGVDG